MDNNEKHFYDSQWFLYLCLFLIYPVGLCLLWFNTDLKKKYKKIISAVFGAIFLIGCFSHSNHSNEQAKPIKTSTEVTVQQQNSSANQTNTVNITQNDQSFLQIAEKEISKATLEPVVDMNILDYSHQNFESTGLTTAKGSFNKDGIKHRWVIEFITETKEPVRFKIDETTIYFLEEKRDAVMDAKMREQQNGQGKNP